MRIKIPIEIFFECIKDSAGNIALIQRRLEGKGYKISRGCLYKRIQEYPSIKEKIHEEREKILDLAEDTIFDAIKKGDTKMALEVLKRLGRERGWGDDIKVDGSILEDIKITIKYIDK